MGDHVGRPERIIDPAADVAQEFAVRLRVLRQQAGRITYRELAARTGYSQTALSEAAGGRQFPSLPVTLAYVQACGGDRQEWEARWRGVNELLATRARAQRSEHEPPYQGLAVFQPHDAPRFFGRETLLADLLRQVSDKPLVALFGPSGCGKSSLLRAGLMASVSAGAVPGQWFTVLFCPGEHPLRELAAARAALSLSGQLADGRRVLVVVDQFEEIFTACRDQTEQEAFIHALCEAVTGADGRFRVVIGARADFYPRCAEYPRLVDALRDATLLVGPMSPAELARVVTKPARLAGIGVDRALVTAVVRDAARQPGSLPLVSHALLQTWLHHRGDVLTLAGYEAAGGVQGALARTAEHAYTGLPAHQQAIARRVLLRLVTLGDGVPDTKRRITGEELGTDRDTTAVVQRLAQARLLTLDAGTVELAHEAMIRAWPRLARWLAHDRAGLRTHRQLTEAAHDWQSLGRETAALYRGSRLELTRDWADEADHRAGFTLLECEFLDASSAVQRAEQAAALRRTRLLRFLTTALAVLLVLATGVSVVAVRQRQSALSRQLAAEALAQAGLDVTAAQRLALRAYQAAPTVQARSALLTVATHPTYQARLSGQGGEVKAVAFTPDGRTLISAGQDQTIVLWDVAHRTEQAVLRGHASPVRALALSPDGRLLASADRNGTIILWNLPRRTALRTLTGHKGIVDGVAFSPDGRSLASAGVDHTTIVWDVASGTARARLRGWGGSLTEVAFSPDGRTVATAGDDGTVALWNPATGRRRTLRASPRAVLALAFSPDGRLLATAGQEQTITIWDAARGTRNATLYGHADAVRGLTFSSDGGTLVSAGYDRQAILWDVARAGRITNLTGHASALYAVAVDHAGRYVAAAGADGTVVLWDRERMPLVGHTGWVSSVAFSHDGRLLATGAVDTTARLWDAAARTTRTVMTASPIAPGPAAPSTQSPAVDAVAFSPDDRILATGGDDTSIRFWDVRTGVQVGVLAGHRDRVTSLAFSPDGRLLASAGGHDATVRLWDVAHRSAIQILQTTTGDTDSVAFSPDGRMLASGGLDQTITLWDVVHRTKAATIPTPSDIDQLAISPDGRLVAAAGADGKVRLYAVDNHRMIATLAGHQAKADAIAFSPNGRLLASGGLDHDVILWDVTHHTRWATLSGHTDLVLGLAFSPDSTTLASASGDHTVITWTVDPRVATIQISHDQQP
jgi:WD40 repeat protein